MEQTPDTGAQPTDSPAVTGSNYLSTLAKDRGAYDKWRATGELPSGEPAAPPAAPSGEQSASNPDATVPDAASEPAPPADKPKKNLQTRTEQLDQEIEGLKQRLAIRRELHKELDALDRQTQTLPAASSPATPTSKADRQRYLTHPNAPKQDQYSTYEEWVEDFSVFVADQRLAEREQVQQRTAKTQEFERQVQDIASGFSKRLGEYETTKPDFIHSVAPQLMDIMPAFDCIRHGKPVGPHNALAEEIMKSDVPGQLLEHFSTPEGAKEWQQLFQTGLKDGAEMLRRFGRIEARFEKRDEPAAAPPPAKTVTSAPTPPVVLGRKPAAAADPVRDAVSTGNFAVFRREQDARDLASRR
jgi:hypothetical protein